MSLYLEYRPSSFEEIKGNEDIIASIQKLLSNPKKCPHAFLLEGPTGCGKTTIARIISNTLNCNDSDYYEIDSGQDRGIEAIREIRRKSMYLPIGSSCRIWVLDEAHKLTNDAQNALLKILEDTPEYVYFILCTTEPEKLIAAIRGRCSQFQVKRLVEVQMINLLKLIVRKEGEKLDQEVYEQIAQDSLGHPRNAINILEQVLASPKEKRLAVAKRSALQQTQSIELCRALIRRAKWKEVSFILNGLTDQDPESIRRQILGYCQSVLLKKDEPIAGLVMECMIENFYNSGFAGLVYACYTITKN